MLGVELIEKIDSSPDENRNSSLYRAYKHPDGA
jgi:hypothetical protein